MIYRVAPETSIRKYIANEIAEHDSQIFSLPSQPLSSEYTADDRNEDARYAQKLKQRDIYTLTLLETALREGKVSAVVFSDEGSETFVSFIVRDDGLIRCFEISGNRDIADTVSGYYTLDNIPGSHSGLKVAEKYRQRAKDSNDLYSAAYYDFRYAYKLAQFLAVYEADRYGTGSADAVIDGDVVEHFDAERQGDRIVYTVTRAYKKAVGL